MSLDDIELDDGPVKPVIKNRKPAQVEESGAGVQAQAIPDRVKLLLAAADIHEKDRNYAAVISTLKPKIAQLPRSGLLQLGRAYAQTNDALGEIHVLELVTAQNSKDYVAQTLLGNAYLKVKRYDDAATAFGTAREVNARYRPAYDGALALLEQSQETYEARTLVLDIIKTFGPDARSTSQLCRMYSGESFVPEKSENACRQAISTDPKNPENYVYLTMALRDTDQKVEAEKTIGKAAARFPASENVQVLAGEMKVNDNNFADSYRFYTQAVKANPQSARAQVGLAKSAFGLQKHAEAIEAFVKACKIDRKTTLDFRTAAASLKKNKDDKWMKYQDAIDERCD
jgi:tetratricopeptide (TPR) repeat protein